MVSFTSNFLQFISISAFFYFTLHFGKQGKLSSSYINNCLNLEIMNWSMSYQLYRFLYYKGFYIISWLYRILDFRDNFKHFFSVIRLHYSCLGIQQYSLFYNISQKMILKRKLVKGQKLWILIISSTSDFKKSVKISKHEVILIFLKIYI